MSNKERRFKTSRLDFIFEQLQKGATAVEVDEALAHRASFGMEAAQVGEQSVGKVMALLGEMRDSGWVKSYRETKKHSREDRAGKDIEVIVDSSMTGLGQVWIQVKSSDLLLDEFIERMGGVDAMFDRRIIAINGRWDSQTQSGVFWRGVFTIAKRKGFWSVMDETK